MHTTINEPSGKSIAEENGLHYMYPEKLTITRIPAGKGFAYRNAAGEKITDHATLERIKKIKIPPAYQNVHISPFAYGAF
jgi:DNA topoisomerase-1